MQSMNLAAFFSLADFFIPGLQVKEENTFWQAQFEIWNHINELKEFNET